MGQTHIGVSKLFFRPDLVVIGQKAVPLQVGYAAVCVDLQPLHGSAMTFYILRPRQHILQNHEIIKVRPGAIGSGQAVFFIPYVKQSQLLQLLAVGLQFLRIL